MSYYLVTNELTKEFAIVESEIMQEIESIIDNHGVQEIYSSELKDDENWDKIIERESAEGYRYVVLEAETDDVWDFAMAGTFLS